MKDTATILYSILAETYALYLKTQNYHWNVRGEHFNSLHTMFEDQYSDYAEAIDEIAERLVGAYNVNVDASFSNFDKVKKSKNPDCNADWRAMVEDIQSSTVALIKQLDEGVKVSQKAGDEGTADLLVGRLRVHEKFNWMLGRVLN